jgi:hypothetical protein
MSPTSLASVDLLLFYNDNSTNGDSGGDRGGEGHGDSDAAVTPVTHGGGAVQLDTARTPCLERLVSALENIVC